ncbi:MAG: twitching motility protein PilT [Thermoplasmata archaeon]|nr:MAG: twitching motility protein PilT [Thermoplasmata archaeon]
MTSKEPTKAPLPRGVIIDANVLFIPFQFGVNLTESLRELLGEGVEIIVPSSVIDELERLPGEDWRKRAALKLARRFRIVRTDGKGDRAILELAKRLKLPVVTQDKELKKRLKAEGIKVITLRERSYFVFI